MKQAIKTLKKYNFLQECILKDIVWKDYTTNLDLVFKNIWTDKGSLRVDLDQERLLVLKFKFVQEFHFTGGLQKDILHHSELVNWGLNEISFLKVEENSNLLKKYNQQNELNHMNIIWEGKRKISLIFRTLNLMESI